MITSEVPSHVAENSFLLQEFVSRASVRSIDISFREDVCIFHTFQCAKGCYLRIASGLNEADMMLPALEK